MFLLNNKFNLNLKYLFYNITIYLIEKKLNAHNWWNHFYYILNIKYVSCLLETIKVFRPNRECTISVSKAYEKLIENQYIHA